MSAAPVLAPDEPIVGAVPVGDGRRGHLRLVGLDYRTSVVGRPSAGRPAAAGRSRRRLTRRGRLVRSLTLVATVLVLALLVGGALGTADAAAPGETVTVRPGDTLSQIAATELPGVPLDQAVVRIQHANGLNSLHVQAGQELVIPQP